MNRRSGTIWPGILTRQTAVGIGRGLDGWDERIRAVLERFGDRRVSAEGTGRCPSMVVLQVLVREYGFTGSYQAVRRHLQRQFGRAAVQAVRRVETPPSVQEQHDWLEWAGRSAASGGRSTD